MMLVAALTGVMFVQQRQSCCSGNKTNIIAERANEPPGWCHRTTAPNAGLLAENLGGKV